MFGTTYQQAGGDFGEHMTHIARLGLFATINLGNLSFELGLVVSGHIIAGKTVRLSAFGKWPWLVYWLELIRLAPMANRARVVSISSPGKFVRTTR